MTHRGAGDESPKKLSDRLLAPGDALRDWWDGLSRVQKWGFGVIGFGLLAALPLFPPPFLTTPNISFGGTFGDPINFGGTTTYNLTVR